MTKLNLAGIGMTSQRTRDRLVQRLADQGIRNQEVLGVMRTTPRHIFLDEDGILYIMPRSVDTTEPRIMAVSGKGVDIIGDLEKKYETGDQILSMNVIGDILVTTSPQTNKIHIWDKQKKSLVKDISVDSPMGVSRSRDNKFFYVNAQKGTGVLTIDAATLKFDMKTFPKAGQWFSGSHIGIFKV